MAQEGVQSTVSILIYFNKSVNIVLYFSLNYSINYKTRVVKNLLLPRAQAYETFKSDS